MCDGLEIDMLSVGNADALPITLWHGTYATRVLVDGGNAGSYDTVRSFLDSLGINYIDHVVCTHPHDDHAAGLVKLVEDTTLSFGQGWMHLPWLHADPVNLSRALASRSTMFDAIKRTMETVDLLYERFKARRIPVREPFAGGVVGCLRVCGPTVEYYEELLARMTDLEAIESYERTKRALDRCDTFEEVVREAESGLLSNPTTSPENESSVILCTAYDGRQLLLTADAGVGALSRAVDMYGLEACFWMQVPHHGSRRNITRELIQHFRPVMACISAEGTHKHPSRAVVNAFNEVGTSVYSTHYPKQAHLWLHLGSVPERHGYGPATPLYEAQ